jgi:hypothetical protein
LFLAHPAALLVFEVAPMQFTADDDFNDHPKTWNLPDSAVALWSRAGAWSARNAQFGLVPAEMLARFCSDPVQAVQELLTRGLWRRVKGGYQFTDWGRVGETAEQAAQKEADVKAKRDYDAERQREYRARRKTAPAGDTRPALPVAGAVTPMSHATSCDTSIDRSDLDQSIEGGRSKSDGRARERPELVTAVADAICAKVGYVPTDDQALTVIGAIRERARKAGVRIRSPLAYIPAAVANEPDLWDGLLLPAPPPRAELAPTLRNPWDAEFHEHAPAHPGEPCRCGYTKSSPRHDVARAG